MEIFYKDLYMIKMIKHYDELTGEGVICLAGFKEHFR